MYLQEVARVSRGRLNDFLLRKLQERLAETKTSPPYPPNPEILTEVSEI